MKRLDSFSRFENGVYYVLIFLGLYGLPIGGTWLVDTLFLRDLDAVIRYPLLAVCWLVSLLVGIAFMAGGASGIEDVFRFLRERWGMKPLLELEAEIRDDQLQREEDRHQWFLRRPEGEKLYLLWTQQDAQLKVLESIRTWLAIGIGLIVALILILRKVI